MPLHGCALIVKNKYIFNRLFFLRRYLKKDRSSPYPPGMSGSAAVVIDDMLYLFGGYGYNGEGCTNRLYRLHLLTFLWEFLEPTGTPPIPVDKTTAWSYNGK